MIQLKSIILSFGFILISCYTFSQAILNADGPGDTYELINSILAPDYNAIEVPDCGHTAFGRHIDEVFDDDLNKDVFRFHIHTSPDNDRCINFDRQRNEIKTYDKSPDSLLGVVDERVCYTWRFKIDSLFQASAKFTHLHQLKAVGGTESSMPLITLTARKGNPDNLELRYAESTSQITLTKVPIQAFKGIWLEATETVLYAEFPDGTYNLSIKRLSDGSELFSYSNNSIRMWKTDAEFIRPKWGIYRSLLDSINLRDEMVFFSDISIYELDGTSAINETGSWKNQAFFHPNPVKNSIIINECTLENFQKYCLLNLKGQLIKCSAIDSNVIDLSCLANGTYQLIFSDENQNFQVCRIVKM